MDCASGSQNTDGSSSSGVVPAADSVDQQRIPLTRHPSLALVLDTPKGRGVVATAHIPARTVLDVSPVLVLDPAENERFVGRSRLWFYTYNWPLAPTAAAARPTQTQALPLGLGSLFNHASSRSRRHNTGWTRDVAAQTITYTTLRDVEDGEELCICYGEGGRLGFRNADDDDADEDEGDRDGMEEESGGDGLLQIEIE